MNPIISVITVCFNAERTIEKTIQSVVQQTYDSIEYIIIDGASTDHTMEIVNRYNDFIAIIKSEPDRGIYDAMNKGIKVASGEWIYFLNAGDNFYTNRTLEIVASNLDVESDIVYGAINKVLDDCTYVYPPSTLSFMNKFMVIPHQGAFIKASYHKKHLFDISFKSSGDYHFLFQAYYVWKAKFREIHIVIADFDDLVGMSKDNIKIARFEDLRIWGKEHDFYWINRTRIKIIYLSAINFLSGCLPISLQKKIRNYKLQKKGFCLIYK